MAGPHKHNAVERHRSVHPTTGVPIAAGKVEQADGIGGVVWASGGGDACYDPADYGALSTYGAPVDDTVALQAALDAAGVDGGTVCLGPWKYYVSFTASGANWCLTVPSNVTLQGDGMFVTYIELDPGSTVPTHMGGGLPIIAIGSPSASADQILIRDLGVLPHWSTKGAANKYLCGIYTPEQTSNFTEHSDDISIQRVRVSDSYIGIGIVKTATIADAGYTASRHQRWGIRECYIDTAANCAMDLQMFEDSEVADNATWNASVGIQLLNYAARVRVAHNSVRYVETGISVREGCSDIDVDGNICLALGGANAIGGSGASITLPAGIALGTERLTAAVASARVVIRNNIVIDTLSTDKVGLMFAAYDTNSGATYTDYLIQGNIFNATKVYLGETYYPANSSAVRLRVFDNYFSGTVTTVASWSSDRTRFERNHVTSNFTSLSNNWDFRDNVFGGTVTQTGTGYTLDDGYVRSVLVSATPPSAGQVPIASSATAAAWGTPSATPSGAAGGDLSGTYPNPSVVDDSHAHTAATLPATTVVGDQHVHVVDEQYSGDAATTVFTLANSAAPDSVMAWVSGVRTPVTLGGASLDQITFGSAPAAAANNISVDYAAPIA